MNEEVLNSLFEKYGPELVLETINEYGLLVWEEDESLMEESVQRAEEALYRLKGELSSMNKLFSEGKDIDESDIAKKQKKRQILNTYISAE